MSEGIVLNYAKAKPRRRRRIEVLCLTAGGLLVLFLGTVVVVPKIGRGHARLAVAKTDLEMIGSALDQFEVDCGRYPTTAEGLNALTTPPINSASWRGPYLKHSLNDPWGSRYVYRYPSPANPQEYQLLSKGADGVEGNADDIVASP